MILAIKYVPKSTRNCQWWLQKPVATHYLQSQNCTNISMHDFKTVITVCSISSPRYRYSQIYSNHLILYYIYFRHTDEISPVFINVVRDPLARAISAYNYHRLRGDRTSNLTLEQRKQVINIVYKYYNITNTIWSAVKQCQWVWVV